MIDNLANEVSKIRGMKKYTLADIKRGNQVLFTRKGIEDFRMYWTVIGFHNDMIEVKIDDMGNSDKLFIAVDDIEVLLNVNDTRYKFN